MSESAFKLKEKYCDFDLKRALKVLELGSLQRSVLVAIASHAQSKFQGETLCLTSDKQKIFPQHKALAEEIGSVRGGNCITTNSISRVVSSLSAAGLLLVLPTSRGNRYFFPKTLFLKANLKGGENPEAQKELIAELARVREFHKTNPKRFGGKKGQKLKPIYGRLNELKNDVRLGRGRLESKAIQMAKTVHILMKTDSEKLSKINFLQISDLRKDASQTRFWGRLKLVPAGDSIEPTYTNHEDEPNIYKPTYDTRNNGESAGFEKVGIEKFFEFEIFTRFARALNQPQASDNQIRKFYAAYLKSPRSFEDILRNLKTLESCSALEFNEKSPGNPHNLKRLLADPESLLNAAAAKRGELGKAYGFRKTPDTAAIAKICLDKGWRAEKTYEWLTGREADESFLEYFRDQKSRHDAEGMRYEQARAREQADNDALEKRLKSEGPEFAEAARTMLRVIGKFREIGENLEKRFAATATLEAILEATEKRSVHGIDPEFTGHKTEAGDQGDEVSKHKSEEGKNSDSTGVAKDSKTGESPEALRGSGNERDGTCDIQAPDRDESDFQRRFRERRERSEQGGFLAGEGIENRPVPEPCCEREQESEPEKPAKPKPTKALMQFNEQLQAGKLAPASTVVCEDIQASGKEAEAGADHAREPEKVQPEDVKKPAPESSEAGNQLRNSSCKGQYLESDSALNKVCGPENVAPEDVLFTHANGETETTPAGKTSQYDFNLPAAGLSAASKDPKDIAADSDLLSLQNSGEDAKNPDSELNLGGTGSSGGRNEPVAETSATSNLSYESLSKTLLETWQDLAAERPESPAGSDVGGFEQEESQVKQKPETLKDSGCEDSFTEDLYQLNSTSTVALIKKSKPESAMEPGQELISDLLMCTEESTAEAQENGIARDLTTASPGFDETAQAVRQPTVASDSESVDENFNGSVTAREKTSAVRDCDEGGENTVEQCGRPGETGEKEMAGCADPSEPRNGETVTDYALRACVECSDGDIFLYRDLHDELKTLETDAEKIDWAEQKLREKHSKEHDITQVA